MRGLAKPWSPGNVSPEGQLPRTFYEAEREYRQELPNAANRTEFARGQFERLDKSKLRATMYTEQGRLCVYCERRLQEAPPFPRIDHWRPLSLNHDVALHWKNLYVCCPSNDTCDGSKGDRALKCDPADQDLPWPTELLYERVLGFTSGGEMYVRKDVTAADATLQALRLAIGGPPDAADRQEGVLNLNHPALVAARKAAIDSEKTRIEKDFAGKTAMPSDRERRAAELLAEDPLRPFVSARTCYLRRRLGKGQ